MWRNYSSLQARSTVFESVCACAEGGGESSKNLDKITFQNPKNSNPWERGTSLLITSLFIQFFTGPIKVWGGDSMLLYFLHIN